MGPSTVRQIYLVLSGVLKFAVRDGRLPKSPADGVQLPRLKKRPHGYLTHSQVRLLADECGAWGDFVRLLAYTGLRWGEMAALSSDRVDFERRRLDISVAVTEVRGALVWGTPKNHEGRSVPVPALVLTGLVERAKTSPAPDTLFRGADGEWLEPGTSAAGSSFQRWPGA